MVKIKAFTADELYPHIESLVDVCMHMSLPNNQTMFRMNYGPVTDGTQTLDIGVEYSLTSGSLTLLLCMMNVAAPVRMRAYASTKIFEVANTPDAYKSAIMWKLVDPTLSYVNSYKK